MIPMLQSYAATDVGTVRKHNEDALVDRPDNGLWAVADGAGGHAAGEIASGMLAETLGSIPAALGPDEAMTQIRLRVAAVHTALRVEAARRGAAMIASTIVVLLVRDAYFACLWAGDSRAYLIRDGVLRQVSRDHSLVQDLLEAHAITPEQAELHPQANVITRAVGGDEEEVELDKVIGRIAPGDRFLLCSDGVNKVLGDHYIESLLRSTMFNPATELLRAALDRGARDNVTAVVVDVPADALG